MNDSIILNIAGFGFRINFEKSEDNYGRTRFQKKIIDRFGGFITKKDMRPEYMINVADAAEIEAIYKSRKKAYYLLSFFFENKHTIRTYYHTSIAEFSMLLRNILQSVIVRGGGFMLHASAVNINGKAVIFTGNSGAGKTTIMTLLSSIYKPLADDAILIKREMGKYFAYQTPILSKDYWIKKNSMKYPIKDIFFLKKSKKFSIAKLENKNSLVADMLEQLLAGKQGRRMEFLEVVKFTKSFDRFGLLGFDKNKRKLMNFFKELYESR